MTSPDAYEAAVLSLGEDASDIIITRNGRKIPMLGPAGEARELSFLPSKDILPGKETSQRAIPVLIGSGTGAALREISDRLSGAYGPDFLLAVVDKEGPIMAASRVKERFAAYPGIVWIQAADQAGALRELTRLQESRSGKPFLPLLNPFYLRMDRDYYGAVHQACEASGKANFWEKAHYAKFRQAEPRLLLLTSQYFLMGEILAACKRLDIPHRLVQMPEGEVGQGEFIEKLLTVVLEFKPDFIFTINHLGVDREGVLTDLLERLRLPLASWFVDNPHLILYLYSSLVSPWTSIFTWDADNIDSLKELGFSHVSYLPLGVDVSRFLPLAQSGREEFSPLPAGWNRQVSFVGNSMLHKVRHRLQRSDMPQVLRDSYPSIAAGFAAGEERSVRDFLHKAHPELIPAFDSMPSAEDRLNYETLLTWEATLQYRLSCIQGILPFSPLIAGDDGWRSLLGESSGWHYRAELNYYEDLPCFYPCAAINFNCTSKQMKGAVNQRVFDVPATESFLLTDYREQVENLFEPGREIICYRTADEASALAREYLARPDARREVARAARKRILREHCYEHRLRTLIAIMRNTYG